MRYGGVDTTPIHPLELMPPDGLFLLAYDDDRPVAMGGWRVHVEERSGRVPGERAAEIKRMYVVDAARGRGFARRVLAALERTAAAAGCDLMVLETGEAQPEAIALYRSAGYTRDPAVRALHRQRSVGAPRQGPASARRTPPTARVARNRAEAPGLTPGTRHSRGAGAGQAVAVADRRTDERVDRAPADQPHPEHQRGDQHERHRRRIATEGTQQHPDRDRADPDRHAGAYRRAVAQGPGGQPAERQPEQERPGGPATPATVTPSSWLLRPTAAKASTTTTSSAIGTSAERAVTGPPRGAGRGCRPVRT